MEEVSLFERMSVTYLSSLLREIIQIDHRNVTDLTPEIGRYS